MPYIGNPIYQSAFVTDQFSGDGTTTAFTMSVAPAGTSNVLVVVSGVVQDPSTYGVVGTTLNFTSAPPSGTGNISCRYLGVPVTGVTTTAYRTVTEFTATASQTTFTPPSYTVGFINVYRNGVLLGSADYTATNGTTVVLATGATVGDLITVESFQVSSVANAIQNTAGSVSSSNIATGAVTPAKLSTGGLTWDTSSNVGIGTSSPDSRLHVLNSGGASLRVGYSGGTTNYYDASTHTFRSANGSPSSFIANQYGIGLASTTPSSGVGIAFPASQSASSDANTLDDYEEGSWTPTITDGYTRTYSSSAGKYIKIGKQVYIFGQLKGSTRSGAAGSYAYITLPFQANDMAQIQQPSTMFQTYNITHTNSIVGAAPQWDAPTEFRIYEYAVSGNASYVAPANIPAYFELGFFFVYTTNS